MPDITGTGRVRARVQRLTVCCWNVESLRDIAEDGGEIKNTVGGIKDTAKDIDRPARRAGLSFSTLHFKPAGVLGSLPSLIVGR